MINQERNRAAAPRGRQRSAAAMYSRVQREVQTIVQDIWAKTQSDEKKMRFRGIWAATGFVEMRNDGSTPQVVMFSDKMTRERREKMRNAALSARERREQEHAPPTVLPHGTQAIYVDGSYIKRSKEDPGSAGYGVSVVENVDGDRDENAAEVAALCGPLKVGCDSVEKLSNQTVTTSTHVALFVTL